MTVSATRDDRSIGVDPTYPKRIGWSQCYMHVVVSGLHASKGVFGEQCVIGMPRYWRELL
jgi:hypothetical protein